MLPQAGALLYVAVGKKGGNSHTWFQQPAVRVLSTVALTLLGLRVVHPGAQSMLRSKRDGRTHPRTLFLACNAHHRTPMQHNTHASRVELPSHTHLFGGQPAVGWPTAAPAPACVGTCTAWWPAAERARENQAVVFVCMCLCVFGGRGGHSMSQHVRDRHQRKYSTRHGRSSCHW